MSRLVGTLSLLVIVFGVAGVQAQNLIQNPGFTSGLPPWTALTGMNFTASWDGNQGNAAAGSAFVNLTSSTGRVAILD